MSISGYLLTLQQLEEFNNFTRPNWPVVSGHTCPKENVMARYHDSASGMISDNKSARANLPQEVIMKDYSSEGMALPENYPGYGPSVIEAQLSADKAKMKSIMHPRKV